MLKYPLIAGIALIATASEAKAFERWVDDWFVYGDEHACVMRIRLAGDTGLTIGADSSSAVRLTLENAAWRSIEAGMPYPITAIFDGKPRVLNATGLLAGQAETPAVAVTLTGQSMTEFLRVFAASHVVSFMRGGTVIDKMSLRGSGGATAALMDCVLESAGDPFAD